MLSMNRDDSSNVQKEHIERLRPERRLAWSRAVRRDSGTTEVFKKSIVRIRSPHIDLHPHELRFAHPVRLVRAISRRADYLQEV